MAPSTKPLYKGIFLDALAGERLENFANNAQIRTRNAESSRGGMSRLLQLTVLRVR